MADVVKIKKARLSFPSLFKKSAMKGEDVETKGSYGCTLILDKDKDADQIKYIKAQMQIVLDDFFGKGKVPKKLKCCFKDGDIEDAEELENKMFLRTSSKNQKPVVVDQYKKEVTQEDDVVYGGCYVHATVTFWCYKNDFGAGISANIRGVMFAGDGEAFGSARVDAETEFDDFEAEDASDDFFAE
jgi:hypothetical protein